MSYALGMLFIALLLSDTRSSPLPFNATLSERATALLRPCFSIEPVAQQTICQLLAAIDAEGLTSRPDYDTSNAASKGGEAQAPQKTSPSSFGTKEKDGTEDVAPVQKQQRCSYREQGGPLLHRYATDRTHDLQETLAKYSAMHRRCTSLEYDQLLDLYKRKTNPQCRYLIWGCPSFGLGNKVMSLVSAFLYAILTQRVLLVDNPEWDTLFCEPFQGSNWHVPQGLSLQNEKPTLYSEFSTLNCGAGGNSTECYSKVVAVNFRMDPKSADHQLLVCPSAMAKVKNVPFLIFWNNNQHFAVGCFLNPSLRPMLQSLFPDTNPFHALSGFLLSPSDAVWEQISGLHKRYLEGAVKRIGVQLRESKGEYKTFFDEVVPPCIRSKSGLCSMEMEDRALIGQQKEAENSTNYISVFVASLVSGHFHKLQESLGELGREMNQRFVVFAQESDGEQLNDAMHEQKALVDLWMLSLSDVLLTTPISTFGYTAQGLGGIVPHQLTPWADNPCLVSVSSEPCFHFASKDVDCKEDGFDIHNPTQKQQGGGMASPVIVSECSDYQSTGLQLIQPS